MEGTLFFDTSNSNKRERIRKELRDQLLSNSIPDNITGLKRTLQMGGEPKLFTDVVKELEEQKLIKRSGALNYSSMNIHKAKKYFIKTTK